MKKKLTDSKSSDSEKDYVINYLNGDYFWSCMNAISTMYDYEIINMKEKVDLQKLVIKKYGDCEPHLFPEFIQKIKIDKS